MMKWDGGKWISLDTKQVAADDSFVYYESPTNSFSPFAISGEKTVSVEKVTPRVSPEVSGTEVAAPLAIIPPVTLNWILYVIVAIIIIAAVYYFARKKD